MCVKRYLNLNATFAGSKISDNINNKLHMKIFKFFMIALVAIVGLSSCVKHEYDDHNADLVGTWTCLKAGFAEALVIKADGSALSTGVEDGEMWENIAGNIVVKDGKITMTFEDNDNFTGHFDIIPGESFSIYTEEGERYIYHYCKEDLSEEIVGMWVCTTGPIAEQGDMAIQTYSEDGKVIVTTATEQAAGSPIVNKQDNYYVAGDLLIFKISEENMSAPQYIATRLIYAANGTPLGDVMTQKMYIETDKGLVETTSTWLGVSQSLNLAGDKYKYSKVFVTNVKGVDREIDFMDYTFNFSKMDGVMLDKMLHHLLFACEFPNANTIKYNCYYNGQPMVMEAPVYTEGNKVAIKMSEREAFMRDVDMYMFQDVDGCQLHMYMPTYSFINFFGNMKITMLSKSGKLDITDEAAVKYEFDRVQEVVESINLSIVMTEAE